MAAETKTRNKNELYRQTEQLLYSYKDMVYISQKASGKRLSETREIIRIIEACLDCIRNEPYSDIIKYKYMDSLSDERISEIKYCDPSTITRQRKKLIKRISGMLYPGQFL